MKKGKNSRAIIIGAGPAGLTAGFELSQTHNISITLIEQEDVVGGLSRTTEFKGCRFDIGPHHFITDSPAIEIWWKNIMRDDFIPLRRFTRIYYKRRFFNYPLQPLNVLKNLNFLECFFSIMSYIKIKLFPIKPVHSLQDWVTNRFGVRLFKIFFRTYTEKLWGIPCHKISADWAAERIKTFSLAKAIFYAFFGRWFTKHVPRTIRDLFYYPSRGAGTLWQKVADVICLNKKNNIYLQEKVVAVEHAGNKIVAVTTKDASKQCDASGGYLVHHHVGDYFLSSMPLRDLILAMTPVPPKDVLTAARGLRYRGLITVNLIVNKVKICPDHWLYIHEPSVAHIRIGNMNNFSLKMVDQENHTALSLEFFVFLDDPFWFTSDHKLVQQAKQELESIGLVAAVDIIDGMVLRSPEAYPIYDEYYKEYLTTVRMYLEKFSNLRLIGRNGMHSYNNMDIAMLSAMKAVNDIINQEKEKSSTTQAKYVQNA